MLSLFLSSLPLPLFPLLFLSLPYSITFLPHVLCCYLSDPFSLFSEACILYFREDLFFIMFLLFQFLKGVSAFTTAILIEVIFMPLFSKFQK